MEYLMTYGWAILVIAVVLGALYSLGVFGRGNFITGTCLSNPGFFCSKPLLNTTGALNLTFGQLSGSTIILTSVGCSNTTSQPSQMAGLNSIVLVSGESVPLVAHCPIPSNTIGTGFTGSVWVGYTSSGVPGQEAMVGQVSTSVATGAVVGKSGTGSAGGGSTSTTTTSTSTVTTSIHYVPITLTNSQSSATGSSFQQLIVVDSTLYSNEINPNWNNVEFTTGTGGGGSTLSAWVESNALNSATATDIWVLLPGGIGANSNTIVYMDFMGSNVLSSGGPTGEAPQLSGTYAQYDNGASIFSYYQAWGGLSSLPSGWTNIGSSSTVSFQPTYTAITSASATHTYLNGTGSAFSLSPPFAVDWYGDMYSTCGTTIFTGLGGAGGGTNTYTYLGENAAPAPFIEANGISYVQIGGESGSGNKVYSQVWSSQTAYSYMTSYNSIASGSQSSSLNSMTHFTFSGGNYGGCNPPMNVYWIRTRVAPPGGVMPTVSFGSLV
ncbi:MAG: hypothetical protein KGH98_04005 [Candidatus Micrarchaeota archaeon]|nr:hypothetical protein [Candidatus Micrarchaeota archaeon]